MSHSFSSSGQGQRQGQQYQGGVYGGEQGGEKWQGYGQRAHGGLQVGGLEISSIDECATDCMEKLRKILEKKNTQIASSNSLATLYKQEMERLQRELRNVQFRANCQADTIRKHEETVVKLNTNNNQLLHQNT